MSPAVQFDPLAHRYYDGARTVPSVTGVLAAAGLRPDFSQIAPVILAAAQRRGQLVHAVVRAIDTGHPIAPELREDAGGYLAAYERFCVDTAWRPIACELPLYSARWDFAGTPDKVGFLGARRGVLDVKTPLVLDRVGVPVQLAAYVALWAETHADAPADVAGALQLRPDGTYRFTAMETARPWRIFCYALRAYRHEASDAERHDLAQWINDHSPASRRLPCPQ